MSNRPDNNPDAVKRLTDDEVASIRFDLANTKPSSSPMGLFRQHCEDLLNERDALCATVRAMRAENSTLKKHWTDTSEDLASAWLKNDELKSANTALREQLAHLQSKTHYLVCGARIEALEDQLAQVTQERDGLLTRTIVHNPCDHDFHLHIDGFYQCVKCGVKKL